MKKHFFSIFILAIIFLANIGSAIVNGIDDDWTSAAFNILISGFATTVLIHLIRDGRRNDDDLFWDDHENDSVADEIINGGRCANCGTHFKANHGFTAECPGCWSPESGHERATIDEL